MRGDTQEEVNQTFINAKGDGCEQAIEESDNELREEQIQHVSCYEFPVHEKTSMRPNVRDKPTCEASSA